MANFLRGLGQLAGVAGQAVQGYGMDRENAVRQAMLKAREQREAEAQALAQKVAEQQMATGRFSALMAANQAGYRKPEQVNASLQKAGAPSGMTAGGVALPENIGAVAQIAANRGQMVDVPGAGQMELDATRTPEALAEGREFRDYGRRSTDRRQERSIDRQDRNEDREDEQAFQAGQRSLDRQSTLDAVNARIGGMGGGSAGQGGGGGRTTDAQKKADALRMMAEQAWAGLDQPGGATPQTLADAVAAPRDKQTLGSQPPSLLRQQGARLPFGIGNYAAGEKLQQQQQYALQLSDAWLRYTSGAAVPEQEVSRFAKTFAPEAGDGEARTKQKIAARAMIVEAMRAGTGYADAPTANPFTLPFQSKWAPKGQISPSAPSSQYRLPYSPED